MSISSFSVAGGDRHGLADAVRIISGVGRLPGFWMKPTSEEFQLETFASRRRIGGDGVSGRVLNVAHLHRKGIRSQSADGQQTESPLMPERTELTVPWLSV